MHRVDDYAPPKDLAKSLASMTSLPEMSACAKLKALLAKGPRVPS
jgi:hypothetical protein